MPELARLPATDHAGLQATIDRDGGVIALDFLPPRKTAALRRDFERAMEGMEWGYNDEGKPEAFSGFTTKRFHGLFEDVDRLRTLAIGHTLHVDAFDDAFEALVDLAAIPVDAQAVLAHLEP